MALSARATDSREFEFTQRDFDFLRKITNEHTGIIVSDDKFDMFYARLSRHVRRLGLRNFREYCELISRTPADEMRELFNSVTTNLTSFFRENHHFEYLEKQLIPEIVRSHRKERVLRIWSAGCSTGEEPYSLAMTLKEALPMGWRGEITATDIDTNVLSTASAGVYSQSRIEGIAPARMKRWFQRGTGPNEGSVRVRKELADMIHFSQLNLMQGWHVEGPFDAIFCRNVLIYFDKETKQKLAERYAEKLIPNGHLFIGHSESLFRLTDQFDLIGNTIYRKVN